MQGILGLADRLDGPRAANAAGLDRVRALLAELPDGMFDATSSQSIDGMIWWVADGLQVCPPHRWGCPVRAKLDPEHIAWTCGCCGTIALGDDRMSGPA